MHSAAGQLCHNRLNTQRLNGGLQAISKWRAKNFAVFVKAAQQGQSKS